MSNQAAAIPLIVIENAPVDADCSMQGLKYMPLYVDELMASKAWAKCRTRPEMAYYLLNLWVAAWRAVPAGSLEDDDDVLAAAANCPPEAWAALRGELLRGWQRCPAQGRLYHPFLTQVSADVWTDRQAHRAAMANARAAKATKRARRPQAAPPLQAEMDLPHEAEPNASVVVAPEPEIAPEPFRFSEKDSSCVEIESPVSQETTIIEPSPDCHKWEVGSEKKGEEPPNPRPTQRGTRLPENWEPTAESHLLASRLGLNSDEMAEAFRDRYLGNGRRSPDWQAAFRDWCRGAHERRQPRPMAQKPGKLDEYADFAARSWQRYLAEKEARAAA